MSKDWLELTEEQRLWTVRNDNLNIADRPEDITCPWCSQKQSLEYDDVSYKDDAHNDHVCYHCNKTFTIRTFAMIVTGKHTWSL